MTKSFRNLILPLFLAAAFLTLLPAAHAQTLSTSISSNPVREGGTTSLAISLDCGSNATAAFTVTATMSGGTAESGDFAFQGGGNSKTTPQLGCRPRASDPTSATLVITAAQDTDMDDETTTVSFSASGTDAPTPPVSFTLAATDDDGAPGKTRNLSATVGNGRVNLSWTAPASGGPVTGYEVSRDGNTFQPISGSTGSTRSHVVHSVRNGTAASFRVRAVNHDAGRSGSLVYDLPGPPSDSVVAAPYKAPRNLAAVPGNGKAKLSFTANSGTPPRLLNFEYSRNGGGWTTFTGSATGDKWTGTVTGLTNGTAYSIRVRTRYQVSKGGNTSLIYTVASRPVSVTPGSDKPDLTVQRGDQQAVLSFGVDIPANLVTRWQYTTNSGSSWTNIAWTEYEFFSTVPVKHRNRPGEFIVSGLANGTQYSFQVRAVTSVETGEASDSVTVTPAGPSKLPAKPRLLKAAAGDGTVKLTWIYPPVGIAASSYEIKRNTGNWEAIPGSDERTESHVVTGLSNGTEYTFRVRAKNSAGDGAESDAVKATPVAQMSAPGAPSSFAAAGHDGHVVLTWTAPATGGSVSYYEVSSKLKPPPRGRDPGFSSPTTVPGGPNATSHVVTGLNNGTEYTFQIQAVNTQGKSPSREKDATPAAGASAPGAPTGLAATGGDEFVRLSWTAPSGPIELYQVQIDTDSWTDMDGTNGSTTSFTVRNSDPDFTLVNGTEYTFKIRAKNDGGNRTGTASASVTATPKGPAYLTPNAPPVFTAVAGNTQVTLSWNWDSSIGLPGALVRSWEYSKDDDGTTWTAVPDSDAGTRTYTVTGLDNGTEYTFRVRAVNSEGKGAASEPKKATPSASAGAGGTSGGFSLTAVPGDGQITLSWPANPDAEGWELNQDDKGWNPISATGSDGTVTYTVTGLENGAAYSFQVREKNGESGSSESNQVSAVPSEGETTEDKTAQSGPTPAQLAAQREMSAAESTAPEMARAMAGGTVDAVRRRIEQSSAGGGNVARMGGGETITGILTANGQALADGNVGAVKQLLADSGFALQLEEAGAHGSGGSGSWLSRLGFWGSGDYASVSDESGALNLEGDALSFHVGADARLHRSILAGVAMSWARSEVNYRDEDGSGKHEVGLTGVHPYLGLAFGRITVWGTGGYSWGNFDMGTAGGLLDGDTDVTLRTFGGGASGELLPKGSNSLRLKTEAMQARMNVKGVEGVSDLKTDVNRLRVSLEGSREWAFSGGSSLRPTVEAGYRRDGGDGRTGSGAEISGGLLFYAPAGLRIEARANTLLGRNDRTQWGVSGQILWGDRKDTGLSFSLAPGYGASGGNADAVWDSQRFADDGQALESLGARIEASVGYGLRSGDRDIVTPYGEMTLGEFERSHRVGMSWLRTSVFSLRLEGERRELHGYGQDTEHVVMLHARLPN